MSFISINSCHFHCQHLKEQLIRNNDFISLRGNTQAGHIVCLPLRLHLFNSLQFLSINKKVPVSLSQPLDQYNLVSLVIYFKISISKIRKHLLGSCITLGSFYSKLLLNNPATPFLFESSPSKHQKLQASPINSSGFFFLLNEFLEKSKY